ncbi:MAG: ABC transporter substrate-binding protein [Syntrophomonadaceae bacterium]|nr:ABC transporter substrate-binding protein [Syntrophomonadaceae bacterium]
MKRCSVLILLLLVVLLTSGCNEGDKLTSQPDSPAAQEKITVLLDWVPNTNHTGLFVAKDLGYYADEGLEVEIIQPGDGGTAQLIGAGTGEFGISYQEDVTAARSQNIPVVAIAAVIQHNTSGFASLKSSNITTPADFSGKTYGGWGSPAETAVLKAIMEADNADFSTVNIMNIGSFDFFTSLEKGVDFAWIFKGWTGIEAQLRNVELNFIRLSEIDPVFDYYTPVIIASEDTLEKNPQLAEKFMRATSKGYSYCIENPEKAADILLDNAPESDRELLIESQKYLAAEYKADAPRWGEMKPEVWKNYADFMFANNLIDKKIKAEAAFTNQFLP